MEQTLLSQIRSIITVDIDSMDPDVAMRHATASETFCDMTSNQAIVYAQAIKLENAPLVERAISYVRAQPGSGTQEAAVYLQDVVDVLTVLLAKRVYPHLQGKVHAQTSPSVAYDTGKTIEHAKKLVALFEAHGIPKTRVCVKIPATPESVIACQHLRTINIHTLATCVFSLPQAQAASQAGCSYVAPYFNELRVHFEPTLWREYNDTVTEHPMSHVIKTMVHSLRESETQIMPASIVTTAEVIALVTLRPNHLTLSASILDQLAILPAVLPDVLAAISNDVSYEKGVAYLPNDAVLLKEHLMSDPETSRKLIDALIIFDSYEKKTKEFIRSGKSDTEWDGQWP